MRSLASDERPESLRRSPTLAGVVLGLVSLWLFPLAAATRGQQPSLQPPKTTEQYLTLEPRQVFRLESEAMLRERMAREARQGINPVNLKYEIFFPESPTAAKQPFVVRHWAPLGEIVDPPYVCYRRLYFEQINYERYGWSLGLLIDPLLSAGAFYYDVVTLPYHAATEPLRRYECNTGYYLPGDPAPLLLYPLEPSLSGALGEAAVIGLLLVFFP